MRIFFALIAVSVLAVAGTPRLDDRAAWRDACKVGRYSCYGLKAPFVAKAPMGYLLGRYKMGDKYILVNERLSGNLEYAVKVHEMLHYIQWKRGAWKFTHESKCQNEREAFEVSNVVLRRLGDTANLVDWSKMRVQYGC